MILEDYIEELATKHPAIQHEVDDKCHFSCLADDSQTKFARSMHYPCVVLDTGDFTITGQTGNELLTMETSIMFLDHVRDTGNSKEIRQAFSSMRKVALDFLKKILRDKNKRELRGIIGRFTAVGSDGHRVYLKDAGLYGYVLFLNTDESFSKEDCEHVFED